MTYYHGQSMYVTVPRLLATGVVHEYSDHEVYTLRQPFHAFTLHSPRLAFESVSTLSTINYLLVPLDCSHVYSGASGPKEVAVFIITVHLDSTVLFMQGSGKPPCTKYV